MGDSSILMPNPDGEFDDRRPGTLQLNYECRVRPSQHWLIVWISAGSRHLLQLLPCVAFLYLQDRDNLHSWVATSMILSYTDCHGFQLSMGTSAIEIEEE